MSNSLNGSLKNKVALVTGGTSGIGEAAALQLAKAGVKVVVAGRRESEGQAVVKSIDKAGGQALFVKTDVSREADVKALVDKTLAHLGGWISRLTMRASKAALASRWTSRRKRITGTLSISMCSGYSS